MARRRTKTLGLISHNTPDGKSFVSEREVLHKKYMEGNITKEELHKYVNFLIIEKKHKTAETTVTIKFGGKTMVLTIEEYNRYYKPAYSSM